MAGFRYEMIDVSANLSLCPPAIVLAGLRAPTALWPEFTCVPTVPVLVALEGTGLPSSPLGRCR
jgi:hypothetical protein